MGNSIARHDVPPTPSSVARTPAPGRQHEKGGVQELDGLSQADAGDAETAAAQDDLQMVEVQKQHRFCKTNQFRNIKQNRVAIIRRLFCLAVLNMHTTIAGSYWAAWCG